MSISMAYVFTIPSITISDAVEQTSTSETKFMQNLFVFSAYVQPKNNSGSSNSFLCFPPKKESSEAIILSRVSLDLYVAFFEQFSK